MKNDEKISLIDVGYTGVLSSVWKEFLPMIGNILTFNPLIKSFNLEKHCHLQLAITDEHNSQPKDFYIYKKHDCSSFFTINKSVIVERSEITGKDPSDLEIEKTVKVDCARLDEIIRGLKNNINYNYLRIDTQGSDLAVLKSAGDYLKNMFVIESEVYYRNMYEGSPLARELVDFILSTGHFKIIGGLRKPNKMLNDYLFININAPMWIKKVIEKMYSCEGTIT